MVDTRPSGNNLPTLLTSFVGRAREVAELRDLLCQRRLLTLTGSGGCGKSRLAVRVATDAAEDFPDGVWWVELAPIGDPDLVAPVLAQVVGVRPIPGQTELGAVTSHLASSRALVLLDNCEHVLEEAARVAEALARGSPSLRVVATSREPLRAEGETEWRVPSLSLPPDDGGDESADASDALRLFVERARQVRPGFDVTAQNAPAIVAICRELDGMPLAIELAAARLRAFSVEQIAVRLADRFRLLAGGARTALPQHRTLHASVGWSHELLSAQERTVFRRLGVFVGGFTLEAAEGVCGGEGIEREQVLDIVVRLVEKSLVQAEERGSVVRYRLLETMRQYALERLEEEGETERTRDRYRDFYLELAERIEPELRTPRQPAFLDVLDPEAANLTLAIERAAATEPDKALRLSVALTLWWRMRSLFAQGQTGFARALAAATEPSVLRARALWGRAFLLTFAGPWDEAYAADGRLEKARAALETLIGQGAAGWAQVLTWAHLLLAEVQRLLGDTPSSRKAASDGLELAHRIGNRPRAAEAHLVLGRLAAARGEWAEAQRLLHEALTVAVECGKPRPPRVLDALAEVAAGLESHAEAARILGAATRQWSELRMVSWPHQRAEAETLKTRVRDALGAEAFERALAEGQALTADEAVAYVRRARGTRKRPSAGWESLTPTELEAARHTASGLSNAEIAERMFISPVTVRTHLTHIFTKLGLKNRSQLTREVARRADTLDA